MSSLLHERELELTESTSFKLLLNFSLEVLKFHFNTVIDVSAIHVLIRKEARLSLPFL